MIHILVVDDDKNLNQTFGKSVIHYSMRSIKSLTSNGNTLKVTQELKVTKERML